MVTKSTIKDDVVERSNDAAAAINAHIEQALKDVHTCLPGVVKSFNSATQTAEVQPSIKRIYTEKGPISIPLLVDVPVIFPGGGGFFLTFPVNAGDECVLHFSERAIDFWFEKGGEQLPSELRTHDYSDAFAAVGVNSKPNAIPALAMDGTELRTRDGGTRIKLASDGTISIGTDGTMPMTTNIHGVLTGQDPCPLLGMTHGTFGCGSPKVRAKGNL